MNTKYIRLLIFAVVCFSAAFAFIHFDVMKYVGRGEHAQFLVDGKPTVYIFYNDKDPEGNTYKIASQTIATIGKKYGDKISVFPVTNDNAKSPFYSDSFRISTFPTLVILNKRGYIVAHYEGILDVEQIDYDLQVLTK